MMINQNKNKAFTLIELLVVIAIIGILSSVVLASLNSARDGARDSKIKSTLANIRAQAELQADGGDYSNTCTGQVASMYSSIVDDTSTDVGNMCNDRADGWSVAASLNESGVWCVDHTGHSGRSAISASTFTGIDCP